jgi:hypothetical protein
MLGALKGVAESKDSKNQIRRKNPYSRDKRIVPVDLVPKTEVRFSAENLTTDP